MRTVKELAASENRKAKTLGTLDEMTVLYNAYLSVVYLSRLQLCLFLKYRLVADLTPSAICTVGHSRQKFRCQIGMVAHTVNHRTDKVKAGESKVQGQPGLYRKTLSFKTGTQTKGLGM